MWWIFAIKWSHWETLIGQCWRNASWVQLYRLVDIRKHTALWEIMGKSMTGVILLNFWRKDLDLCLCFMLCPAGTPRAERSGALRWFLDTRIDLCGNLAGRLVSGPPLPCQQNELFTPEHPCGLSNPEVLRSGSMKHVTFPGFSNSLHLGKHNVQGACKGFSLLRS